MTQLQTEQGLVKVPAGTWTVDPTHSSVAFEVKHMMISTVRGHFSEYDGALEAEEDPEQSRTWGWVRTASIDTGNADRDAHVLSPDIVDVSLRPTIVFRSTRVTEAGDDYAVDGNLTIGGITHPVTLDVELGGLETFPGGPRHAGFEATAQFRRKDFDIDVALPPGVSSVALGDVIKIEIDLQLLEPEVA